ncbi:MAG: DUF983 domain-containing protein [Alphaproteobacteria bacterium]|nr:DUF983 domain-containing protein [Alphaproteobacteria bacterium]
MGRGRHHAGLILHAVEKSHVTFRAALLGRCPRCAEGSLFAGYLNVARSCSHCGLDFSSFDPGDGPAVLVILLVGCLVAGGALILEAKFQPPYWVHAVIWLPVIALLSFAFLRLVKSTLLVLQYKHRAGEARLME